MESIIQQNKECFLCGKNGSVDPLEEHHVFGAANRKHSEKYGLKIWLCGNSCHRNGPLSVHRNRAVSDRVKAIAQAKWEETYGAREEFLQIFGRNYL